MKPRTLFRVGLVSLALVAAGAGFGSLTSVADPGHKHCPRGIRSCSASQVGQPCDPNNLNVICSAQANGSYCCLAYAP